MYGIDRATMKEVRDLLLKKALDFNTAQRILKCIYIDHKMGK